MNKKIITTIVLAFIVFLSYSQGLTINFNYGCFTTADGDSYLETYISIPQNELKSVKNDDGLFNSSAQITLLFKEDDKIVDFLKYELTGIPVKDTSEINNNIIDQQRVFLDNNTYIVDIQVIDKNDTTNFVKGSVVISLNLSKELVCSSTICFIDSYTKSSTKSMITRGNYDMVPYLSNFFPAERQKMTYYNEIYNLNKFLGDDAKIALYTYIEDYENIGHVVSGTTNTKRETAKPVLCLFNKVDITDLPTGNYWFVVCIKDELGKEVIKTKKFFQRENDAYTISDKTLASIDFSNTFVDRIPTTDSLKSVILSFMPKATLNERAFIADVKNNDDTESLRQFIMLFWSERDFENPEQAYSNYMAEVKKVNTTYGNSMRRGYDTDRGRVYLQYGPPDHVEKNIISSGTNPYEIWQYYEIAGQRNKRFVFATQDAAIRDYDLVHSDVFGELNNPKWQYDLYKNAPIIDDALEYQEMWGTPMQRTFDNPY